MININMKHSVNNLRKNKHSTGGAVNLRLKIYFFNSALFLANDDTDQKRTPIALILYAL